MLRSLLAHSKIQPHKLSEDDVFFTKKALNIPEKNLPILLSKHFPYKQNDQTSETCRNKTTSQKEKLRAGTKSNETLLSDQSLSSPTHMDVSENNGTPKSSILIGVFHYKPSIVGYPYFWKHSYRIFPLPSCWWRCKRTNLGCKKRQIWSCYRCHLLFVHPKKTSLY